MIRVPGLWRIPIELQSVCLKWLQAAWSDLKTCDLRLMLLSCSILSEVVIMTVSWSINTLAVAKLVPLRPGLERCDEQDEILGRPMEVFKSRRLQNPKREFFRWFRVDFFEVTTQCFFGRWMLIRGFVAWVWPTCSWDPVVDFAQCNPSRSRWSCVVWGRRKDKSLVERLKVQAEGFLHKVWERRGRILWLWALVALVVDHIWALAGRSGPNWPYFNVVMNILLFLCSPRTIVQTVPRFLFAGAKGQVFWGFGFCTQQITSTISDYQLNAGKITF